jgi:hypothetical protein
MPPIKTRIRVSPDGTLSGRAAGLPPGEHDAEIVLLNAGVTPVVRELPDLLARVRIIQAEVARLPVLDPRHPDELIGYNEHGHFD